MSVVGVKCCWNRVEMLGVIRKKLYRDVKGTRHGRKRMKDRVKFIQSRGRT